MEKLIMHCDSITNKILSEEPFASELQEFMGELAEFIKYISVMYSKPEYISHQSDIMPWIDQIKRLQVAISQNDTFFLLDVISYELKENLIEAKEILGGIYGN